MRGDLENEKVQAHEMTDLRASLSEKCFEKKDLEQKMEKKDLEQKMELMKMQAALDKEKRDRESDKKETQHQIDQLELKARLGQMEQQLLDLAEVKHLLSGDKRFFSADKRVGQVVEEKDHNANQPQPRPFGKRGTETQLARPPRLNEVNVSGKVPLPEGCDTHFFLSHFQAVSEIIHFPLIIILCLQFQTGSDQVSTLELELAGMGFVSWYDNKARDLTKAGMEAGVAKTGAFVLFLSKGVMARYGKE
jgi:hypothetical protein